MADIVILAGIIGFACLFILVIGSIEWLYVRLLRAWGTEP
jgi:DMSO/TMAO reductase YedYZ heme-binding membrane subunit